MLNLNMIDILAIVQQPSSANKVMNSLILGAIIIIIVLITITLFDKKK